LKPTIGSLKRLTGLSEATLRFYEGLGLLKPFRDKSNGYRYYDKADLLQLFQITEYSAFHIPLAELPSDQQGVSIEDMGSMLRRQCQTIESTINELYETLTRIKLFQNSLDKMSAGMSEIVKLNIGGIYRLFLSDPQVAAHPAASLIASRWLSYMPQTHSTIRIPLAELNSRREGPYDIEVGLGMLEGSFIEKGETYQEPMRYTPPNTCIHGTIAVDGLDSITPEALSPFIEYLKANSLIPIDDMFGWVVYIASEGERRRYYLSLRVRVA
jgi:DNA-binding transcriptional MerR regulator